MKAKKEQMWQAYVDGELSATEMAAFEETLSASERRLLSSDVQFDRAFNDRLAEDATCPDDVWARTKALLETQVTEAETVELPPDNIVRIRPSRLRDFSMIAAAAIITLMISWVLPVLSPNTAPVTLAEQSVDELAAHSEVEPTPEQIQQYMHQHNYRLRLEEVESLRTVQIHGDVRLLGAARNQERDYGELYVACCQYPVKIVIAEINTPEAEILAEAMGRPNDLQAIRIVDNYVVGVVSKHPSVGLLDIFAGQHL